VVGVVNLLALLCTCAINAAATENTEGQKARQFNTTETRTLYAALEAVYAPYPWDQPLPAAQTPRLEDLCRALRNLDTEEGRVLIDEARHLLNQPVVLAAIHNMIKRVRTRGVAMILADQNVNTYTETARGQDILSNAPYAFIGKLEGKDLEKVLPLFPHLNES